MVASPPPVLTPRPDRTTPGGRGWGAGAGGGARGRGAARALRLAAGAALPGPGPPLVAVRRSRLRRRERPCRLLRLGPPHRPGPSRPGRRGPAACAARSEGAGAGWVLQVAAPVAGPARLPFPALQPGRVAGCAECGLRRTATRAQPSRAGRPWTVLRPTTTTTTTVTTVVSLIHFDGLTHTYAPPPPPPPRSLGRLGWGAARRGCSRRRGVGSKAGARGGLGREPGRNRGGGRAGDRRGAGAEH